MKLFTLLTLLFITQFSFADAWDNLSKSEAEAVVADLKENPYIFNYCDCCDFEGEYAVKVYLMKVISSEIVECEWDNAYFSVKLSVQLIAELKNTAVGPAITQLSKVSSETVETSFYMNYTWGVNPITKKATPFFNKITYTTYEEDPAACKSEFDFPVPEGVKKVSKDKGYAAWYKAHVK